jgi:hypothetical protein
MLSSGEICEITKRHGNQARRLRVVRRTRRRWKVTCIPDAAVVILKGSEVDDLP